MLLTGYVHHVLVYILCLDLDGKEEKDLKTRKQRRIVDSLQVRIQFFYDP